MTTLQSANKPMPEDLAAATAAEVGQGVSNDPGDLATPQLKVAQSGSPECDPNDAAFIAGAEPGDLIVLGSVLPVFKGETGVSALHCGQITTYSEFMPGRQGFVERHLECPDDVEARPAENGSKRSILIRRGSGNLITETREIYLIAQGTPCVLFCSGTKHGFARRWMTWIRQQKHPNGGVLPSYARRYRLFTVPAKNALGKWFALQFEDLGWTTPMAEYQAAKEFNRFVEGGTLRIAAPTADAA
jgi:hypothetical protein